MHPVLRHEPWKDDAACRGAPSRIFFEDAINDQGKVIQEGLAEARTLCGSCPVKQECLAYAMEYERGVPLRRRYGVWAGTVPEDRVLIDPIAFTKQNS